MITIKTENEELIQISREFVRLTLENDDQQRVRLRIIRYPLGIESDLILSPIEAKAIGEVLIQQSCQPSGYIPQPYSVDLDKLINQ